jgi:hypothetical protein
MSIFSGWQAFMPAIRTPQTCKRFFNNEYSFPNSFLVHLVTLHTLMMGGSKTKVVVGLNSVGVLVTGQPLNLSENSSGWQLCCDLCSFTQQCRLKHLIYMNYHIVKTMLFE